MKKSHDELLQDVVDFVGGRLEAVAFRDLINADPAYGDVVNDEGLRHAHWSHSNREPTYVVMMMVHYDDATQVGPIRGYLRDWLEQKGHLTVESPDSKPSVSLPSSAALGPLADAAVEGLAMDLLFTTARPTFGDLYQVVGETHPSFPPSGTFSFDKLAHLGFEQQDDYFGIPSKQENGDDVVVWLYPIFDDEIVQHHAGSFTALRLAFNVLRNTEAGVHTYLNALRALSEGLPVEFYYCTRAKPFAATAGLERVRSDAALIAEHWKSHGIVPGSTAALEVDF